MKALVLKGSPKKSGNTATMADAFAHELHERGVTDIVEFSLNDLSIRPCQACDRCLKPPYAGCVLQDDFQQIYPELRDADLVVLAAPIYWWHLCAQMKAFIDRWHAVLTFDRDHYLTRKHMVLLLAHVAEDPYGVGLVVKMFESIAGWVGMGLDVVRFHSSKGPVQDAPETLERVRALAEELSSWEKRPLSVQCPLGRCGLQFADLESLAMHMVMAAGDNHLEWKAENLSAIHTLENTSALRDETLEILRTMDVDVSS